VLERVNQLAEFIPNSYVLNQVCLFILVLLSHKF
jgi:hypothetical protein